MSVNVRAKTGSRVVLTKAVAAAIGAVNPPVSLTFRPLADQIGASLVLDRLMAVLAGFVGGLALAACLGRVVRRHGVLSRASSRRDRPSASRLGRRQPAWSG